MFSKLTPSCACVLGGVHHPDNDQGRQPDCQLTQESIAEGGLLRVFLVLTNTLEPTEPLQVLHVPTIGREDADASSETFRPFHALTDIGRKTREVFNAALAKRFLPRHGEALTSRTHLFDHDMLISLNTRKFKYIDLLLFSNAGKAIHLATASEIK